jgi:hypothetical protein
MTQIKYLISSLNDKNLNVMTDDSNKIKKKYRKVNRYNRNKEITVEYDRGVPEEAKERNVL